MRLFVMYELNIGAVAVADPPRPHLVLENRSSYIALESVRHCSRLHTTDLASLFADSVIDSPGESSYFLMFMGRPLPASLLTLPFGVIYDALHCGRTQLPFRLELSTRLSKAHTQTDSGDIYEQAVKQALYLLDTTTFKSYMCGSDADLIVTNLLATQRVNYIPVKVIEVLDGDSTNNDDYRLIQPAHVQPSTTLKDLGIEREDCRVVVHGIALPNPVRLLPLVTLYEKLRSADGWLYLIVRNL
jgi:hypothetical protein